MRRTIGTIAAAGLCLFSAGVSTQNPPQPVPRFRTGLDLVLLDVSVLDRDRVPVRGLTASDFTILEDGRRQDVASFAAVDLPDTERTDGTPASPAWTREVAIDVQRNDENLAAGGIFVIVMDDATPMPAADVSDTKTTAHRVIDRLGPNDLAAVVFAFNQVAGQPLTHDRARLRAAIDRFNGSIDLVPGGNGQAMAFDKLDAKSATLYGLTVGTLRAVAEHLIELPQRRKALVFISPGLPLDLALLGPMLAGGSLEGGGSMADTSVVQRLLYDLLQVLDAAGHANVNVYSLDPGGLRTPGLVRSPLAGTAYLEGSPGKLNREFLKSVSEDTGGFAITNTNDLNPGISRIVRENASYYLLGYQSSNPRADGRFRRLEVQVNRPGVTVRARNGYFEPGRDGTGPAPARTRPATQLDTALAGPFPSGDMPLRVATAPFAIAGGRKAAVAIVLGVRQPSPSGSAASANDNLAVEVRAYDMKGRLAASNRLAGTVTLPPSRDGRAAYEVLSRLDLEPGRYQLRVAAESSLQGKSGSVFCDLDVPDFSSTPVSLSGVAIGRVPGLASAGNDTLGSLVPFAPTAEREFDAGDAVSAFCRVYQGGKREPAPVTLRVTMRDAADAAVFEKTETLERDRFSSGRASDVRVELPTSTLKPGPHLLTIEATLGKQTSRRQVRFVVR